MPVRDSGTGALLYSPSDLGVFFESPFASWMDRAAADAETDRVPALPTRRARLLIEACAAVDQAGRARPEHVEIVSASGDRSAFRTDDLWFFYLGVKRSFLDFHAAFDPAAPPIPEPRADHGRWNEAAARILDETDHPSRVAGIFEDATLALARAGITTMTALARTTATDVPGLEHEVFERLHLQARLQLDSQGREQPLYEVIDLASLPPASSLDVFFDMEGYPLADDGLEYLFGAMVRDDGARSFVDLWAHDAHAEKRAVEAFLDWVSERFTRDPAMHVYHYAPYEVNALRRLTGRYATREDALDALLRAEVFVDLYRVVRQGVIIGEPRYSLKNVEHLYRGARATDVATGEQSIVEYARWLEAPDGGDWTTSKILAGIRDYNRDDCESTLELADWLWARRAEACLAIAPPEPPERTPASSAPREDELLASRMLAMIPDDRSADEERWRIHELLAHLVLFHRREDKPFWWGVFDRQKLSDRDLVLDPECLGDLVRTAREPWPDAKGRAIFYEYAFDPDQETKIERGSRAIVVRDFVFVDVAELELGAGRAVLRQWADRPALPERVSLVPNDRVPAGKIVTSIARTAARWADDGALSGALRTILGRSPPVLEGHAPGAPLLHEGEDLVAGATRVVRAMRDTALAIQGPPGSGKTHTAARVIAALVADGKRVGVASNSHKAIDKLMTEVLALGPIAGATKIDFAGLDDELTAAGVARVTNISDVDPAAVLVGGTTWTFSDAIAAERFDYLFVDEAGQVSLANLVGMVPAARNVVLLGDPMQLSQPTQGSHPGESGLSSLAYLLEDHVTIPPALGIFLARTWRLHPALCSFISGAFYEDRLGPEPVTARRVVRASAPGQLEAGLRFISVVHEGNTRSSVEEGDAIVTLVAELLGRELVLADGTSRPVRERDILVVAPYNLQVRLLRERLPGMRIASVDKFQGQEAPIVIVSMATSRGVGGRGLGFVLDPNRLNVALSRAESLAIVVGSPALATARVRSVRQMKRVNLYCRILAEAARS